jgi:hypothetical protein
MIIGHVKDVQKDEVQAEGVEGAAIQWLLGPKQDVPHFHMRYVTVAAGGVIPLHSHGPIHQMFIVKGQGAVLYEGARHPSRKAASSTCPPRRSTVRATPAPGPWSSSAASTSSRPAHSMSS